MWLLLSGWCCAVQAQGQGSYGGIADDFIKLALIVFLVVLVLVLIGIRWLLGTKVALGVLVLLSIGFAYLLFNANLAESKRLEASKKIRHALAVGCAETIREIGQPAKGDERIYLHLLSAESVPEYQQLDILPSKYGVADGVEITSAVPPDEKNGIVVEIKYSRDLLPGSYPGYEFQRTKYELIAKTIPEGKVVARTIDMQAQSGFCLGDLDAFLKKALNRSAVLGTYKARAVNPSDFGLPDAYVLAKYSDATTGVYLKSAIGPSTLDEIKDALRSQGCSINDSSSTPPFALCRDVAQMPVEVPLYGIVGLHQHSDSWILVYRLWKGGDDLTSLRVEQRSADWQLMRSWRASAVPRPGDTGGGERLAEFSMNGDTLVAAVYWGHQSSFESHQHWYTGRSILRVPLPGVAR